MNAGATILIIILAAGLGAAIATIGVLRGKLHRARSHYRRSHHNLLESRAGFTHLLGAHDMLQAELDQVTAERNELLTRRDSDLHQITEMRLRSRILPDIDDRLDLIVFNDAGPSPIFDSMPVGLLAPVVAAS